MEAKRSEGTGQDGKGREGEGRHVEDREGNGSERGGWDRGGDELDGLESAYHVWSARNSTHMGLPLKWGYYLAGSGRAMLTAMTKIPCKRTWRRGVKRSS